MTDTANEKEEETNNAPSNGDVVKDNAVPEQVYFLFVLKLITNFFLNFLFYFILFWPTIIRLNSKKLLTLQKTQVKKASLVKIQE